MRRGTRLNKDSPRRPPVSAIPGPAWPVGPGSPRRPDSLTVSSQPIPAEGGARLRPVIGGVARLATSQTAWVTASALLIAICASTLSGQLGYITLYNDARSHLNIARHVTDSLTPGFAQLGSVWLPLPHLLMVPLTVNDFLWHTGIAGSAVGGLSFVFSALRLYQLVDHWTESRVAAWSALVAFMFNVNLLYAQSTALTEPVLIVCLIGASYHFADWLKFHRNVDLNLSALFTLAGTLTRYDAWFYLLIATLAVAAVSWVRSRRWSVGEANGLIFAVLGGYGIALWLLYNAIIFGDPLYFMHSIYSAQAQQTTIFAALT